VPETTPGADDSADDLTDNPLDDGATADPQASLADDGTTDGLDDVTAEDGSGDEDEVSTDDEGESSDAPSGPRASGADDWMPGAAEPAAKTPARSKSATIRDSAAATKTASQPKKTGRTTAKGAPAKTAPRSGRYTPPIPKEVRESPRWFPFALLGFLVLGLLMIVLNYVHVLPGGTNNWYLIGGIGCIVVGLFMATFYH
jgi:hypothetical protein